MKRSTAVGNKHCMYELPHELPNAAGGGGGGGGGEGFAHTRKINRFLEH